MPAHQLSQLLLQISLLSSEKSLALAPATENSDMLHWLDSHKIQCSSTNVLLVQGSFAQIEVIPFSKDEPESLSPIRLHSKERSSSEEFILGLKLIVSLAICAFIFGFLLAWVARSWKKICLCICGAIFVLYMFPTEREIASKGRFVLAYCVRMGIFIFIMMAMSLHLMREVFLKRIATYWRQLTVAITGSVADKGLIWVNCESGRPPSRPHHYGTTTGDESGDESAELVAEPAQFCSIL